MQLLNGPESKGQACLCLYGVKHLWLVIVHSATSVCLRKVWMLQSIQAGLPCKWRNQSIVIFLYFFEKNVYFIQLSLIVIYLV